MWIVCINVKHIDTCWDYSTMTPRYTLIDILISIMTSIKRSMSHGAYTNESWRIHKWVMAHTGVSHGYLNIYYDIYQAILLTSSKWMSHGAYTNESWHTHEWVMDILISIMTSIKIVAFIWLFCILICIMRSLDRYGVATITRLLNIAGLFCRISSLL